MKRMLLSMMLATGLWLGATLPWTPDEVRACGGGHSCNRPNGCPPGTFAPTPQTAQTKARRNLLFAARTARRNDATTKEILRETPARKTAATSVSLAVLFGGLWAANRLLAGARRQARKQANDPF